MFYIFLKYALKYSKILFYIATPTKPKNIWKPETCISLEKGRVP